VILAVDWKTWVKGPGANPPEYKVSFATADAQKFEKLADDYIALGGKDHPANFEDYKNTDDPQVKVIFLNRLVDRQDEVTADLLALIDKDFECNKDKNPEIGQRWLPLAIALEYQPVYDAAHAYVSYQGRMKYINPVYIALVRNGRRDLANQWFKELEGFYHPIAAAGLKKIIYNSVSPKEEQRLAEVQQMVLMGHIEL
jgi:hypothetical protein